MEIDLKANSGNLSMSIVVTPDETTLLQAFADIGIAVTTENLLVGDVHVRDKSSKTVYIFERKAKTDLIRFYKRRSIPRTKESPA